MTRARAPVLQTELRANRYKQNHSSEPTSPSKPTAGKQTVRHKIRASVDKSTNGASHLEDLFSAAPDRKTKITFIRVPEPPKTGNSKLLDTTNQTLASSPARSESSVKTVVELIDLDFDAVPPAKDLAGTDVWQPVSINQHSDIAKENSPIAKRPTLHILTGALTATNTIDTGKSASECAQEVTEESIEKLVSPASVVSEATTADSSIYIITERAEPKVREQEWHQPSKDFGVDPVPSCEESPAQQSPLRADAQEFVPGQTFSPTAESYSNASTGSPLTVITNASTELLQAEDSASMPMHHQLEGVRSCLDGSSTAPSPVLYRRPMYTLPIGMTSPYRYVPTGVPYDGVIDPTRVAGINRTNWRERNPVPCEILSLNENTLQPAGYPGHTPLEWREISLAIADYNSRRNISPIPFGVDARARFFQPGKPAVHVRGGSADDVAKQMEIPCLCRNKEAHIHQKRMLNAFTEVENMPRCIHCGSRSHTIDKCEEPPLFHSNTPQHVTLQTYLHTSHWKRKHVSTHINYRDLLDSSPFLPPNLTAPFTCNICPERHSNDEVAQVIESIVAHIGANGEEPSFNWKEFWVADFSQCPTVWALRPIDAPTKLFIALNPLGNIAIQELVDTAGEALRANEEQAKRWPGKKRQEKTVRDA